VIEEEIAEGDAVVHRWTARGHNALTGKSTTVPGISIYHLREGALCGSALSPTDWGCRGSSEWLPRLGRPKVYLPEEPPTGVASFHTKDAKLMRSGQEMLRGRRAIA